MPAVVRHYSPIPEVGIEGSTAKRLVTVVLPMGKALPGLRPLVNVNGLDDLSLHDTQVVSNNVVSRGEK